MNRLTITSIDRIIEFMSLIDEDYKKIPLRCVNIGYDINKEPGLKNYRHMNIGQFLTTVISYNNLPRKLSNIVAALMASTTLTADSRQSRTQQRSVQVSYVNEPKQLPSRGDLPFFVQAAEVIQTLLAAKSTLNETHRENAERLKLSFNKGWSDAEIANSTNLTKERVRQVREEFQTNFMEGKVQKELSLEYEISQSFIDMTSSVTSIIENQTVDYVQSRFGMIEDSQFQFITRAFGLKILTSNGKEYLVKKGNYNRFCQLLAQMRITLRKEFDFLSLSSLTDISDKEAKSFLTSYLTSQPELYELSEDMISVRMIGEGLRKITRIARIIFEAGEWIDKDIIAARYVELYGSEAPALNQALLRSMGFTPQNKTGKWRFGITPPKIQEIIRKTITPERPLVTFKTIQTAAVKIGLDYPLSTIRAYITEIATPENRQSDLFCLKGYCHLYPNYSWRSYRKVLA